MLYLTKRSQRCPWACFNSYLWVEHNPHISSLVWTLEPSIFYFLFFISIDLWLKLRTPSTLYITFIPHIYTREISVEIRRDLTVFPSPTVYNLYVISIPFCLLNLRCISWIALKRIHGMFNVLNLNMLFLKLNRFCLQLAVFVEVRLLNVSPSYCIQYLLECRIWISI